MCSRPSSAGTIGVIDRPGCVGNRRHAGRLNLLDVGVLLPQVEVGRPGHRLRRVDHRAEHLILVVVERLGLLGAVGDPVVGGNRIVESVTDPRAHVIERQIVEPIGPRVVRLILGVVALETDRTRPLPEVDGQTRTEREHVGAIGLKDVAVDPRPRLVRQAPLQRFCGLAELQIEARTEPPARSDVRHCSRSRRSPGSG